MSSFPELPNIEPSQAELLKTCDSRAKFRAEPRLDTPLEKPINSVDSTQELEFTVVSLGLRGSPYTKQNDPINMFSN